MTPLVDWWKGITQMSIQSISNHIIKPQWHRGVLSFSPFNLLYSRLTSKIQLVGLLIAFDPVWATRNHSFIDHGSSSALLFFTLLICFSSVSTLIFALPWMVVSDSTVHGILSKVKYWRVKFSFQGSSDLGIVHVFYVSSGRQVLYH